MYSDKINNPINIDEKITNAKIKYFKFENTKFIAEFILNHCIQYLFEH